MTELLHIRADGRVQLLTGQHRLVFRADDPIPQAASDRLNSEIADMQADGVAVTHCERNGTQAFSHLIAASDGTVTVAAFDTELFDEIAGLAEDIAAALALETPPLTDQERRERMTHLSRRQVFIMLAEEGFLTDQEAEDAAAGNAVPAAIAAGFDAQVTAGTWTAAERRAARISFLSFTIAARTDPLVPLFVAAADPPPSDEQLDTWWETYAAL